MSKFWDDNADAWIKILEGQAISTRKTTNAAILEAISNRGLTSLLDIGCGEGWLARALPQETIYLGIDGSSTLLQKTKREDNRDYIHVTYNDLVQGKWKPSCAFSGIVFNFSILDENIVSLLKCASGFLEPNGTILIQTLHPCFALADYRDAWRSEDFKTTSVPFKSEMPWYGRTLETWIREFKSSGLYIDEIFEPTAGASPVSIIFALKK